MRYNSDITLEAAQSLVDAIMVRFLSVFYLQTECSDITVAIAGAGKEDCGGGV